MSRDANQPSPSSVVLFLHLNFPTLCFKVDCKCTSGLHTEFWMHQFLPTWNVTDFFVIFVGSPCSPKVDLRSFKIPESQKPSSALSFYRVQALSGPTDTIENHSLIKRTLGCKHNLTFRQVVQNSRIFLQHSCRYLNLSCRPSSYLVIYVALTGQTPCWELIFHQWINIEALAITEHFTDTSNFQTFLLGSHLSVLPCFSCLIFIYYVFWKLVYTNRVYFEKSSSMFAEM